MSARSAPTYQKCVRPTGLFIGTATMICLMILAMPVKAQSGKPKQPALPPVRYNIQLWEVPGAMQHDVNDISNKRQTVGAAWFDLDGNGNGDIKRGFFYDPAIDAEVAFDLNEIVVGIPDGWYIRMATAINEVGQITAHIEPIANMTGNSSLSEIQAVVIDMNQVPPSLQVIPDRAFTVYSVAGDINDFGDVTARYKKADGTWGHYVYDVYNTDQGTAISDLGVSAANGAEPKINNSGVIVGKLSNGNGYRISSTGFATLSGLTPLAINEYDAFCGSAFVTITKPRGTANYAFVFSSSLTLNKIASKATDLNDSGDSLLYDSWLNHGTSGNLSIKDLINRNDPNFGLSPSCRMITNRYLDTDFPVLAGLAPVGGKYKGIHLIPVPAP